MWAEGGHNEGAVYSLTSPQDGDIEGAPNPWRPDPGASLSFTILPEGEGNGTSFWDLEFLAPQGELLQPGGHYISGTTPDSPDAFFALLSGYECVSTGATFDVLEISVDAEGVAQTFAASFSATCVGGEAHGEIRVNSTVPVVAAEMGPLYVNLPMTELGSTSAPLDVTLESTGTADLHVTADAPSADFAIVADSCTGATLPMGATCTIQVAARPTAAGIRTGTLPITTDTYGGGHVVRLETAGHTTTTTVLSTSSNPVIWPARVTLTATVTPATASGIVDFREGGGLLGVGNLKNGETTLSAQPVSDRSYTAVYRGDTYHSGSTSEPLDQHVLVQPQVTVWANPVGAPAGQPMAVWAVLEPVPVDTSGGIRPWWMTRRGGSSGQR